DGEGFYFSAFSDLPARKPSPSLTYSSPIPHLQITLFQTIISKCEGLRDFWLKKTGIEEVAGCVLTFCPEGVHVPGGKCFPFMQNVNSLPVAAMA
ncbi:MAG: hypothetical protein J6W75_11915, partial [Bacteroidaceae bacterium]|nr:hypothetical protein [Bacteroidaceae bacterium]